MNKKQKRYLRFISIFLILVVFFKMLDFTLSEIADIKAYTDAVKVDDAAWRQVYEKLEKQEDLTKKDYDLIFSQTGLGKPAVDKLASMGLYEKVEEYRQYYLADKDFVCFRDGVFACHEYITDSNGNAIQNPMFANLQNGDIIVTLSIHSLGWRHGHAAIVVDAENGIIAQAVMIGEKSALGSIIEWWDFPLVAVLRAKNVDEEIANEIAKFAKDKLIGIDYSIMAGLLSGRDENVLPSTTQCAHFVWYAYNCFGIDVDSNGNRIVTPKEILHSDKLEIVQVYGNIMDL